LVSIISTEHGIEIVEMRDLMNARKQISFNRELDPNESETREKQSQNAGIMSCGPDVEGDYVRPVKVH
jgi:hypothetical protein